ncbi:MAG TPA: response regulator transcription factor [Nitrospiraceae bacterium]|nr:response regulator transcription factor [Nitrospiraceae bacterium]
MKLIRLLLADDHILLLDSLKHLLEAEYTVVGTASDGRELIGAAIRLKPDVIVADIAMPHQNGLDAIVQVKKFLPQARIIVMTALEDPDLARHALSLGVSGFLLKSSAAGELFEALRAVCTGRRYVSSSLATEMEDMNVRATKKAPPTRHLSPRQRQVLQLLAEGHTMKEAAAMLGLTARTVAFHKYQVMEAFHVKSNAELVQLAINQKLIFTPQQPCQF